MTTTIFVRCRRDSSDAASRCRHCSDLFRRCDVVYRAGSPGEHPGAPAAVRRLRLRREGFPELFDDGRRPYRGGPKGCIGLTGR